MRGRVTLHKARVNAAACLKYNCAVTIYYIGSTATWQNSSPIKTYIIRIYTKQWKYLADNASDSTTLVWYDLWPRDGFSTATGSSLFLGLVLHFHEKVMTAGYIFYAFLHVQLIH